MNKALKAMQPNDKVIKAIIEILPQDMLDAIKKDGMNKFDFALFVVKMTVDMKMASMNDAWDLVFGKGTYAQFKDAIYELLKESK